LGDEGFRKYRSAGPARVFLGFDGHRKERVKEKGNHQQTKGGKERKKGEGDRQKKKRGLGSEENGKAQSKSKVKPNRKGKREGSQSRKEKGN